MKKIYIYCDGGFGNRFNVLLSGLCLAKYCNLIPKIIWKSNNWCGAEFEDIFDPSFDIIEFDRKTFFNRDMIVIAHENQFENYLSHIDANPFSLNKTQILSLIESENKDVFYFTNLIPNWADINYIYDYVMPEVIIKVELEKKSIDYIKQHTNNEFFGIHIRKTDFANEINDNNYIDLVINNKHEMFFICSDDYSTEQKFLQYKNVFSYKKSKYVEMLEDTGNWNSDIIDDNGNHFNFNIKRSKESVIDAIIDMLILSKSTIINTNLRSTFLQSAVMLKSYNYYKNNI